MIAHPAAPQAERFRSTVEDAADPDMKAAIANNIKGPTDHVITALVTRLPVT